MGDPRVVRFEIEFDDGRVVFLEGDDAQRHAQFLDSCCVLAHIHGMGGPQPAPVFRERKK